MRWLPGLTCLLVLTAGCVSEESDPEPAQQDAVAADALADGLAALFTRTSPESADAASCFGDRLVSARGADGLAEDGIVDGGVVVATLPPLDRDAAAAWVDAWFGCVDFTAVVGRAQAKVTKTLDVPAFEACFRDRLGDAEIRAAATDGLAGDTSSAAVRRLARAQRACAERHD